MTFIGFYLVLSNAEYSLDFFLIIISMILGICGYAGFIQLLNGLHKTNHLKKIILLSSGLLGFVLFMRYASPRKFTDWLVEFETENLIDKWPLIVSILFITLTLTDLIKNKTFAKTI